MSWRRSGRAEEPSPIYRELNTWTIRAKFNAFRSLAKSQPLTIDSTRAGGRSRQVTPLFAREFTYNYLICNNLRTIVL